MKAHSLKSQVDKAFDVFANLTVDNCDHSTSHDDTWNNRAESADRFVWYNKRHNMVEHLLKLALGRHRRVSYCMALKPHLGIISSVFFLTDGFWI